LYVATLAVGHFDITHSRTRTRTGTRIPVINAYSTDLPAATAARRHVPNVTARFSLETQTRVFYELAHQWWGDEGRARARPLHRPVVSLLREARTEPVS
jgi:hypothetical protein